MKKTRIILFVTVLSSLTLFSSSCSKDKDDTTVETATINFEDVTTDSMLYNASFTSGIMTFTNNYTYTAAYSYWTGFACSTKTDTVTAGSTNQYSSYAGSGAGSSTKFAIAYDDSATCSFGSGVSHVVNSIMLTNNTYAALSMKNGDSYETAFTTGDYFKVTITGYNTSGTKTNSVDFYLADFRSGKSYICKSWTQVDLSSLGSVNKLKFTFTSSQTSTYYGVTYSNTPTYACVDNITYVK